MTDTSNCQQAGSVLTAASALTILGSKADSPSESFPGDSKQHEEIPSPSVVNNGEGIDNSSGNVTVVRTLDVEVPMTFPQRLMEILMNKDHEDIISWLPHGRGFIIFQKKRFAAEILPKYFRQSKFTSFTRKLNRWGFVRQTRGTETGAYYHDLFLRDMPRLCLQMCCYSGVKASHMEARQTQFPSSAAPHPLPNSSTNFPGHFAQIRYGDTCVAVEQKLLQLRLQACWRAKAQTEAYRRAMLDAAGFNPHMPSSLAERSLKDSRAHKSMLSSTASALQTTQRSKYLELLRSKTLYTGAMGSTKNPYLPNAASQTAAALDRLARERRILAQQPKQKDKTLEQVPNRKYLAHEPAYRRYRASAA